MQIFDRSDKAKTNMNTNLYNVERLTGQVNNSIYSTPI